MIMIARRLLITLCALYAILFLSSPAFAADQDFPLEVNGQTLDHQQFHNLLRVNAARLPIVVRQLKHQGANFDFEPQMTNLRITSDNLKDVAARALELDKILDAALPTGSPVRLRGQDLVDALEYFRREGKAPPIVTEPTPITQPLDDPRFPLDAGRSVDRVEFHTLLITNSRWLQEKESDLKDTGLNPRFVNLKLTSATPKRELEAVATRAVRLDNIIKRFEKYRQTMPYDRLILALRAHQAEDVEIILEFLKDFAL